MSPFESNHEIDKETERQIAFFHAETKTFGIQSQKTSSRFTAMKKFKISPKEGKSVFVWRNHGKTSPHSWWFDKGESFSYVRKIFYFQKNNIFTFWNKEQYQIYIFWKHLQKRKTLKGF